MQVDLVHSLCHIVITFFTVLSPPIFTHIHFSSTFDVFYFMIFSLPFAHMMSACDLCKSQQVPKSDTSPGSYLFSYLVSGSQSSKDSSSPYQHLPAAGRTAGHVENVECFQDLKNNVLKRLTDLQHNHQMIKHLEHLEDVLTTLKRLCHPTENIR